MQQAKNFGFHGGTTTKGCHDEKESKFIMLESIDWANIKGGTILRREDQSKAWESGHLLRLQEEKKPIREFLATLIPKKPFKSYFSPGRKIDGNDGDDDGEDDGDQNDEELPLICQAGLMNNIPQNARNAKFLLEMPALVKIHQILVKFGQEVELFVALVEENGRTPAVQGSS